MSNKNQDICLSYSDHDWDLESFPGFCKKCGANYLNTWPDSLPRIQQDYSKENKDDE